MQSPMASSPMQNGAGSTQYASYDDTNPAREYARILYEYTRQQMDNSFGSRNQEQSNNQSPPRSHHNSVRNSSHSRTAQVS